MFRTKIVERNSKAHFLSNTFSKSFMIFYIIKRKGSVCAFPDFYVIKFNIRLPTLPQVLTLYVMQIKVVYFIP
jgi:hypothetical protein